MNREFVDYKTALALKELGFDNDCFGYWDNDGYEEKIIRYNLTTDGIRKLKVLAPLYQQAFRWFREEHGLFILIQRCVGSKLNGTKEISYTITGSPWDSLPTYEEAELACLDKLIEIVKNK